MITFQLRILYIFLTFLCHYGSSQFCYRWPRCKGVAQAITKDGKDCCSKNGISFFLDERCYSLECSAFEGVCRSQSLPGRKVIDCQFNHQIVLAVCSFDGSGYRWSCSFPLELEMAVFGSDYHILLVTATSVFGNSLDFFIGFRIHSTQENGAHISLTNENDRDSDGVLNDGDNCRDKPNISQKDADGDGVGDICDNCPYDPNPWQLNNDVDLLGDVCDDDDDNDKIEDREDNCPFVYNPHQRDADKDRIGDACDKVAYSNTSTQNHSGTEGVTLSTHDMEHSGIVYVGLEKSVYLVSESSRQVQLCAVVDFASSKRSVEFAFKVSLSINNTREVCEDCLDNVSLTLSFAPREKRACANLILKDNEIAEMVKSFPIFLERTHDLDANVKVDPFIGELIIFDDDDMVVGFSSSQYNVARLVMVCVELLNPPSGGAVRPFTVTLVPLEGQGEQCSPWSHRRLHFTTGQSRVCTDYNLTNGDSCVLKEVHLNLVSTTKLHVDSKLSAAKIMAPGNSGEKSYMKVGYEHTSYTISDVRHPIEMCVGSKLIGVEASFAINITTTTDILKPGNLTLYFSQNATNPYVVQCYNASSDLGGVENICQNFIRCRDIRILSHLVKTSGDESVEIIESRAKAEVIIEIPTECNCSVVASSSPTLGSFSIAAVVVPSVVLVVVIGVGVITSIGVFLVCRSRTQTKGYVPIDTKESSIKFMSIERTKRSVLSAQLRKQHRRMIFSRNHVEVSGTIDGEGESGLIYTAHLVTTAGKELVVVKSGNALLSGHDTKKRAKEVSAMLSFEHSNVMSLIGVCIEGEMPLLIMPFMPNGSLLEFLRHHQQELFFNSATEPQVSSARSKLLNVCRQVATGMEYLAAHKFVHRNLAARNCMIDSYGLVKVTDYFRLTEDIVYGSSYNKEKGEGGSEEKAPIRWMAPESIENDIYTESTDVWSFGVTVWEIFTCGRIPYTGIPAMGLLKELQRGQRLERPDNEACSVEIYEIMMLCLSLESRVRPKFKSLVVRLSGLLQRDSGYPQLSDHFLCWKQSCPRQFTVTFVPTL